MSKREVYSIYRYNQLALISDLKKNDDRKSLRKALRGQYIAFIGWAIPEHVIIGALLDKDFNYIAKVITNSGAIYPISYNKQYAEIDIELPDDEEFTNEFAIRFFSNVIHGENLGRYYQVITTNELPQLLDKALIEDSIQVTVYRINNVFNGFLGDGAYLTINQFIEFEDLKYSNPNAKKVELVFDDNNSATGYLIPSNNTIAVDDIVSILPLPECKEYIEGVDKK